MVVTARTYEQIALEEPDRNWELHHGRLREKPPMSFEHNSVLMRLGHQLMQQLNWDEFQVRINLGRVQHGSATYYVPDVLVVPNELTLAFRDRHALEVYDAPLPLVVEVGSLSTGDYDISEKIPEYQRRGDAEIWRIHPYERTVTIWRQQVDGSYADSLYREGLIEPAALPNVVLDLAVLFG